MRSLAIVAVLTAIAACAPRPAPVTVTSAPMFPEFIAPVLPPALAASPAAARYHRGWRFLQAGDLKSAEREFTVVVKAAPAFYPAEAGLGYVELARKDAHAALVHFDRTIELQGRELSALAGRGQALLALDREAEALAAFEEALAVDPTAGDLARRVEVLRFRGQREDLNQARLAARGGRLEEAVSMYNRAIADSPDSAILYRELADIERQQGDGAGALEHARRAVALDPADAKSLIQLGDILEEQRDFEGAAKAYADALASEPSAAAEAKLDHVRELVELARLPDQYRAIEGAAEISRGDLAALVGVRLSPLLQAARRREVVLMTDIRDHWAAAWVVAAARAGVIEPFANHTFQPHAVVRRIDLAQVVSRLLETLAEASPGQPPNTWQSARLSFSDLAAGHVAYPAASAAVAAGVMTIDANDSFYPSQPVSGTEAGAALARLEVLARPLLAKSASAR